MKNTLINNESDLNVDANASVNALVNNIEKIILNMCVDPNSILEIAECLGYKDERIVRKHIIPLIKMGRLAMTLPDKPNSRNQKYITIK